MIVQYSCHFLETKTEPSFPVADAEALLDNSWALTVTLLPGTF